MERVTGATLALDPELTQQARRETLIKVEAFIEPCKFERVMETLRARKVPNIVVSDVRVDAGPSALTEVYRGVEYRVEFLPKVKLELVVPWFRMDEVIEALSNAARTRNRGDDDNIIAYAITEAIHIKNDGPVEWALR